MLKNSKAKLLIKLKKKMHTLDSLLSDKERFKNCSKWMTKCFQCGKDFQLLI